MSGEDVLQLILFSGAEGIARRAHLGAEQAINVMKGTCDILLSFLKHQPELAGRFAGALSTEVEAIRECLCRVGDTREPEPEPREHPAGLSPDTAAFLKDMRPPMSAPLRAAMLAARDEARVEDRDRYSVGDLLYHILSRDCEARTALCELTSPEAVGRAADAIRSAQGAAGDFMAGQKEHITGILDSLWPQLRQIAAAKDATLIEIREKNYAENPDAYEASLNLGAEFAKPVPEERAYTHRAGQCMHAARNEARIRRAPEVTLDHMFYALLQEGTATHSYLRGLGVDTEAWRVTLDRELPRYDEGPRWPPNARDLGMSIPRGDREIIWKKDLPDDIDVEKMTREQRAEYAEVRRSNRKFTDLLWLRGVVREDRTIGSRLLNEAGVTEDALRAEIKAFETGDPNWYLVCPDLAAKIAQIESAGFHGRIERQNLFEEAAQFEARSRWAPELAVEHYILAILVDGTDTAALLDDLGLDREALRSEIDAALPRYESGPYFPKRSRDRLFPSPLVGAENGLSDLHLLWEAFEGSRWRNDLPTPPGVEILQARGVTLDAIRSRLVSLAMPPREYPANRAPLGGSGP